MPKILEKRDGIAMGPRDSIECVIVTTKVPFPAIFLVAMYKVGG